MSIEDSIKNWVVNLDRQIVDTKEVIVNRKKEHAEAIQYQADLNELLHFLETK